MNRTAIALSLALAISVTACRDDKTAIEGSWTIDLPPMIRQAQSMGASARDIQQVRDTFNDGRMRIDSDRITLTIPGFQGSEVFKYKIASKEGKCFRLSIAAGTYKYCVDGDRLEVHDPGTRLVAMYRKS